LVRSYLLEKCRVVIHPTGERNYHIFYQLISAAIHDSSLSQQLNLANTSLDFRYAHRDDVESVPNVKDFESYGEVRNAMNVSLTTTTYVRSISFDWFYVDPGDL
jgi:myosin heavy subunit